MRDHDFKLHSRSTGGLWSLKRFHVERYYNLRKQPSLLIFCQSMPTPNYWKWLIDTAIC